MKIVILGKNGQLGRCLRDTFLDTAYECLFFSKSELDITDLKQTRLILEKIKPLLVINATAYTKVDKAEEETEKAYNVNHFAVKNLANICKDNQYILIHISTDFVFDGEKVIPYKVSEAANPLNVYGDSKLKGEQSILKSKCTYQIIRTSWVFSEYGNNFLKTMLNLSSKLKELKVVDDQYSNPTYAHDLAKAIKQSISQLENNDFQQGLFHYSGQETHSWYTFAKKIFRNLNKEVNIVPITADEYITAAKRPKYSSLDTSLFSKQVYNADTSLDLNINEVITKINGSKN